MTAIFQPMGHIIVCKRYVLNDTELAEIFDLLDVDKDGRLSRNEIAALLRTINVEPTRVELDFLFHEMDAESTGKISKEEFIKYMTSPFVHRETLLELERQFTHFDSDSDGNITENELLCILRQSTEWKDDKAIHERFLAADLNKDGKISFLEFVKFMQQ